MKPERSIVTTPQADIAVWESGGTGLPVLLIHGNSSCKEVFARQIEGDAGARYRLIAMDLPGHGQSSDAAHSATYSIPGYAETAASLLQALEIRDAIVLGWSLGGHVALELLAHRPGIRGAMIVGASPFAHGAFGMIRAFHFHFGLLLALKGELNSNEVMRFGRICLGAAPAPHFADAIARTDPRARIQLKRSMLKAEGMDQKRIVQTAPAPLAVLNGSNEPFARLDHVAGLDYANLWNGACHVIEGAGHAPFLERPDEFNAIFELFLDDVSSRLAPVKTSMLRSA